MCGIKLLIHSQTSRIPFSGSIFWLDIRTWYTDSISILGLDICNRYSDSKFGRDYQTWFSDSIFTLEFWTWISYFIPHIKMDVITGLPQSSQKIVTWLLKCHHKFQSLERHIPSINFFWQNIFIITPKSVNFLNHWCIDVVLFKQVSTRRYFPRHENCGYLGRTSWKTWKCVRFNNNGLFTLLRAIQSPSFLKPMQIFVKNVHNNYSTY